MDKRIKKSILISYLIGLPIGLLFVGAVIVLPVIITDEGLFTLVMLGTYWLSTIGLVISFIIVLWFGGITVHKSIENGNSLLLTSFKYSLLINLIIWTVFCLIIVFTINAEEGIYGIIIPPIIAFVVCTILTTLTIGLIISYVIKLKNGKDMDIENKTANNVYN